MNHIPPEPGFPPHSASPERTLPRPKVLNKRSEDVHPAGLSKHYETVLKQMAWATFSELPRQPRMSESYPALSTGSENNNIPDQGSLDTNYKSSQLLSTNKEICAWHKGGDVYFNPQESGVAYSHATETSSKERTLGILKRGPDCPVGDAWLRSETRGEAESLSTYNSHYQH